jgi:lysophospholipase L1-like esterase
MTYFSDDNKKDISLKFNDPNSVSVDEKLEFKYFHKYNSIGIRNSDLSSEVLNSSKVILALGDSFTEGIGAPQDSTWPYLLQKKINEIDSSSLCINAGISGSDVFLENYKYKERLNELYHPDIVIIAINSSDLQDIIYRGGKERFKSDVYLDYKRGPWWSSIYAFSHIFRLVVNRLCNIQINMMTPEAYEDASKKAADLLYEEIYSNMFPFSVENNTKLVVVFMPMQYELENSINRYEEVINKLRNDSLITVIDLTEKLHERNITEYESLYWEIDMHNNSKGYNIWAEEIAKEIYNL